MKKEDNFELYQTQVQTNVSFTSFFTAVVIFFVGLLITKFDSYDILIKVPIALLIISVFGFLYSTLIFANASEEASQRRYNKLKKYLFLGDILSEYLGIYLLVLSIPLVINVVTNDIFLRIITILSSLIGLAIYQFSHFSVLERHFGKANYLISTLIILFGIILFISQIYNYYFIQVSIAFIVFILLIVCISYIKLNKNS
ncbi:MAG: hypothetical protein AABX03_03310 [Nanoarchaeota archaeon]